MNPDHLESEANMSIPIERVVALATPVFAAFSAWLTAWIGRHFPGMPALSPGDITALQIAGFTGAAAAALHWLSGRQKFVQFAAGADKLEDKVLAAVRSSAPASVALADIENVLRSHTDQIVTAIGSAVHAPPSVEEVARQVLKEAAGGPPS